jgi:hypothetical protein
VIRNIFALSDYLARALLMSVVVRYFAKILVVAVAGFLSVALSVQATTSIRVSVNNGVSWMTLGGPGDGTASIDDASFPSSGWSFIDASGSSLLGSQSAPTIGFNGTVTSTRAGTLLIEFTANGYGPTPMVNHFDTYLDSHNNNVGSAITKVWSYAGLGTGGGGLFAHDAPLGQLAQVALTGQDATSVPFSRVGIPGYANDHYYSLTLVVSVFHNGAGTSTFDTRMVDDAVPDGGATVALLGLSLFALVGVTAWFRRLNKA